MIYIIYTKTKKVKHISFNKPKRHYKSYKVHQIGTNTSEVISLIFKEVYSDDFKFLVPTNSWLLNRN